MTNFNYDNYDDDTKAKYDDGIEFLDDDFWCDKIDKKPEHVLIDELPFVLEELLGTKCEMATMTSKSLEEYYGHRDWNKLLKFKFLVE